MNNNISGSTGNLPFNHYNNRVSAQANNTHQQQSSTVSRFLQALDLATLTIDRLPNPMASIRNNHSNSRRNSVVDFNGQFGMVRVNSMSGQEDMRRSVSENDSLDLSSGDDSLYIGSLVDSDEAQADPVSITESLLTVNSNDLARRRLGLVDVVQSHPKLEAQYCGDSITSGSDLDHAEDTDLPIVQRQITELGAGRRISKIEYVPEADDDVSYLVVGLDECRDGFELSRGTENETDSGR